MIETFRSIVEDTLEWRWSYGTKSFANLTEAASATSETPFLHLDPLVRSWELSRQGTKTGWENVSGGFLILLKDESSPAEVYDTQKGENADNGKWKRRIRPIVEDVGGNTALLNQLMNELNCHETLKLQVKEMNVTEVINIFDDNLDGVNVRFKWRVKV